MRPLCLCPNRCKTMAGHGKATTTRELGFCASIYLVTSKKFRLTPDTRCKLTLIVLLFVIFYQKTTNITNGNL